MKKRLAAIMAAVMVVSGIALMPVAVDAADEAQIPNEITWGAPADYPMNDYWKADGTGTAPVKDGYVFGGWYTKTSDTEYTPIDVSDTTVTDDIKASAYAKFVPAYVLSVKAQNASGTTGTSESTSIRVISSVDSVNYQKVGFKILLNNKIDLGAQTTEKVLETSKVYTALQVGSGDSVKTVNGDKIFGEASEYISVWRLDGIVKANYAKIINVRPYWVTLDGTTVEGLAKYVHVEDGYSKYVSVPINLYDADKGVAAGVLEMSYDESKLKFHSVEYDGVFPQGETAYNDKGNGIIKFVANGDVIGTDEDADGIYANVRFELIDDNYKIANRTPEQYLKFIVSSEDFSNWAEDEITINAWDIQY